MGFGYMGIFCTTLSVFNLKPIFFYDKKLLKNTSSTKRQTLIWAERNSVRLRETLSLEVPCEMESMETQQKKKKKKSRQERIMTLFFWPISFFFFQLISPKEKVRRVHKDFYASMVVAI